MTRDQELAWAAGFFDGEGSTFTTVQRKCMFICIAVQQSTNKPLNVYRFQEIVGIGKVYVHAGNHAVLWRTYKHGEVRYVLELLWPYLSCYKREQGRQAFERFVSARRGKCEMPPFD
jgi:hypothetical protein